MAVVKKKRNTEDIAFVNYNASSLFLSLKAISKSHNIQNVIISRGEIEPTSSVLDKTEENADEAPEIPENNN